jgi:carboxyl-terminal processing protease
MQNLVLDLRGNSGGYLQTAIDLVDEFIAKDKLIVYTEGRAYAKDETYSTDKGKFKKGKLVVLIDEGSASASEIVSGAVQDWDRGLIIGRRSFGKGLVQRPFNLPDGSAMRLTVSRYFTPSGRCIQRPYEGGDESYYKDLQERYSHGELVHPDSIKFPDSLIYSTKIRQRKVYGGGGIMPDLFVPIDTSNYSQLNNNLIRKGVFNSFTLTYADKQKSFLKKKYATVREFDKDFDCDKTLMDEFFAHAAKEGVEFNEEQYQKSKSMIDSRLKAMIARSVWDTSAYYQVFNPQWPTYQKALSVLKNNKLYMMQLVNN